MVAITLLPSKDMACDRVVPEPDLAIGLEVCDFINATKKNTPREAAVAMLRYINGGVQHQAMLALHV